MSVRANNPNPNRKTSEEKPFLCHRRYSRSRVSEASDEGLEHGARRPEPPKRRGLMSRPIRFLKHFAGEIARVLRMVSGKRRSSPRASGRKSMAARSKPFVAPVDSQRVEAIEDCIQFLNSSCTFSRSNSITSST